MVTPVRNILGVLEISAYKRVLNRAKLLRVCLNTWVGLTVVMAFRHCVAAVLCLGIIIPGDAFLAMSPVRQTSMVRACAGSVRTRAPPMHLMKNNDLPVDAGDSSSNLQEAGSHKAQNALFGIALAGWTVILANGALHGSLNVETAARIAQNAPVAFLLIGFADIIAQVLGGARPSLPLSPGQRTGNVPSPPPLDLKHSAEVRSFQVRYHV